MPRNGDVAAVPWDQKRFYNMSTEAEHSLCFFVPYENFKLQDPAAVDNDSDGAFSPAATFIRKCFTNT